MARLPNILIARNLFLPAKRHEWVVVTLLLRIGRGQQLILLTIGLLEGLLPDALASCPPTNEALPVIILTLLALP